MPFGEAQLAEAQEQGAGDFGAVVDGDRRFARPDSSRKATGRGDDPDPPLAAVTVAYMGIGPASAGSILLYYHFRSVERK